MHRKAKQRLLKALSRLGSAIAVEVEKYAEDQPRKGGKFAPKGGGGTAAAAPTRGSDGPRNWDKPLEGKSADYDPSVEEWGDGAGGGGELTPEQHAQNERDAAGYHGKLDQRGGEWPTAAAAGFQQPLGVGWDHPSDPSEVASYVPPGKNFELDAGDDAPGKEVLPEYRITTGSKAAGVQFDPKTKLWRYDLRADDPRRGGDLSRSFSGSAKFLDDALTGAARLQEAVDTTPEKATAAESRLLAESGKATTPQTAGQRLADALGIGKGLTAGRAAPRAQGMNLSVAKAMAGLADVVKYSPDQQREGGRFAPGGGGRKKSGESIERFAGRGGQVDFEQYQHLADVTRPKRDRRGRIDVSPSPFGDIANDDANPPVTTPKPDTGTAQAIAEKEAEKKKPKRGKAPPESHPELQVLRDTQFGSIKPVGGRKHNKVTKAFAQLADVVSKYSEDQPRKGGRFAPKGGGGEGAKNKDGAGAPGPFAPEKPGEEFGSEDQPDTSDPKVREKLQQELDAYEDELTRRGDNAPRIRESEADPETGEPVTGVDIDPKTGKEVHPPDIDTKTDATVDVSGILGPDDEQLYQDAPKDFKLAAAESAGGVPEYVIDGGNGNVSVRFDNTKNGWVYDFKQGHGGEGGVSEYSKKFAGVAPNLDAAFKGAREFVANQKTLEDAKGSGGSAAAEERLLAGTEGAGKPQTEGQRLADALGIGKRVSKAFGYLADAVSELPPGRAHEQGGPAGVLQLLTKKGEFEESKHPRASDGKFGSGSGSGKKEQGEATAPPIAASPPPTASAGLTHQLTKVETGKSKSGEPITEWRQKDGSALPEHVPKRLPPGWSSVRISDDPKAALVAKGVDSKGREQYVYSAEHSTKQAGEKFARINELRQKSDDIAHAIRGDLHSQDPKRAEVAGVALLVQTTGIRPGSDTDTKAKEKAYGATTLEGRHVTVAANGSVSLDFVGKKGVSLSIPVTDPQVAKLLQDRKAKTPDGAKLFPGTSDANLRDYVHEQDGGGFKPKDFRTAHGTSQAATLVAKLPAPATEKEFKARVTEVANHVSKALGNTPAVALQSYIDPSIFSGWRGGLGGGSVQKMQVVGTDVDVYFGEPDAPPVDWRKGTAVDEDPDDEELQETPPDVIAILGFDPKDLDPSDAESGDAGESQSQQGQRLADALGKRVSKALAGLAKAITTAGMAPALMAPAQGVGKKRKKRVAKALASLGDAVDGCAVV